jgi:hypothetical protein
VLANDVRLYHAEEVLSIASRLQQARSILAKTIAAVVSDRGARQRYLSNAADPLHAIEGSPPSRPPRTLAEQSRAEQGIAPEQQGWRVVVRVVDGA